MHLCDGVLSDPALLIGANLIGAATVIGALNSAGTSGRRGVAFSGTLAAFVLVAQAINVPFVPGASAHLIGAGLLALCIGPARAILALFAVLMVQALLLGDGGITVLGINTLNIAVLPVLAVSGLRRLLGDSRRALLVSAFAGTLLGNALGATSLASLLVWSAAAPLELTFGWLLAVQSLAGAVEGVLTALLVSQLWQHTPELFRAPTQRRSLDEQFYQRPPRAGWALVLCVVVGIALLPLSSHTPDALEVVLTRLGPGR